MNDNDPLSDLLASSDHADALRFALLCAYASGWSDAFDRVRLAIDNARLAALIESVAIEWQARMVTRAASAPVPPWLAALQEGHAPEPWNES